MKRAAALLSLAQNTAKAMNQFTKNPIGFSIRMANNVAQTGLAIFAAVVNGLKKAIYGKDEVNSFFYLLIEFFCDFSRIKLALEPDKSISKTEESYIFQALQRF